MDDIFQQYNCIGILGGTFNPVHNGHIDIALKAMAQYEDMECVAFMPNNLPAYKNTLDIVDSEHRINMLLIATRGYDDIYISDLEIKRGGITYTYDTLMEIKEINPDIKIYFIVGADSLYSIKKWHRYEDVLRNCILLVAGRDSSCEEMQEFCDNLYSELEGIDIRFIDMDLIDISSSELRSQIYQGIDNSEYLNEEVSEYILDNMLYGCEKDD